MKNWSENIFKIVRGLTAALLIVVVSVTLAQIILRYLFNSPLIWSEELARFLTVWITFLGAAVVCFDGRHLNVDIFLRKLSRNNQQVLNWLNTALSLAFLAILFWTSIKLVKIEQYHDMSVLPLSMAHIRVAATVGAVLMAAGVILRLFHVRSEKEPLSMDGDDKNGD